MPPNLCFQDKYFSQTPDFYIQLPTHVSTSKSSRHMQTPEHVTLDDPQPPALCPPIAFLSDIMVQSMCGLLLPTFVKQVPTQELITALSTCMPTEESLLMQKSCQFPRPTQISLLTVLPILRMSYFSLIWAPAVLYLCLYSRH